MKGVVKTNFCYKGTNKDLERSRIRFVVRVFVELEEEQERLSKNELWKVLEEHIVENSLVNYIQRNYDVCVQKMRVG